MPHRGEDQQRLDPSRYGFYQPRSSQTHREGFTDIIRRLSAEPKYADVLAMRALQRLREDIGGQTVRVSATLPDGTQLETEVPADNPEAAMEWLAQVGGQPTTAPNYLGGNFVTGSEQVQPPPGVDLPSELAGLLPSRPVVYSPITSSTRFTTKQLRDLEQARKTGSTQNAPVNTRRVAPRFTEENVIPYWNNLSPLARVALQQRAVDAGVLDVANGDLTPKTMEIVRGIMGLANVEGLGFDEAAYRYFRNFKDSSAAKAQKAAPRPTFQKPAYIAPDWSAIAQDVKTYAQQRLGRRLRPWEVQLLGDELSADHRKAYEQIVSQGRADFDAAVRAQEQDGGEVATASAGAEVDPVARFRERFDELYQGEMEVEEAEDDNLTRHQLLLASLTQGDRVFGD